MKPAVEKWSSAEWTLQLPVLGTKKKQIQSAGRPTPPPLEVEAFPVTTPMSKSKKTAERGKKKLLGTLREDVDGGIRFERRLCPKLDSGTVRGFASVETTANLSETILDFWRAHIIHR